MSTHLMPKKEIVERLAGQAGRRKTLLAEIRRANRPCFSEDGAWLAVSTAPYIRDRCWHALAFLDGTDEDVRLGNRIIQAGDLATKCDFMAFFSALLLRLHETRLEPSVREALLGTLRERVEYGCAHIFRFTENCAALNVFALLEAAERFAEPRFLARALERLEAFAHHSGTFGVSQEFFSMGYWGVTVNGFAAIAEFAASGDARRLAQGVEAALWREMAAAWHPNLRYSAAPSARNYTAHSLAGPSLTCDALWLGLGDEACFSSMAFGLFDETPECPLHGQDAPLVRAAGAWMAAAPYHVNPETAAPFFDKPLPYRMRASIVVPGFREHEKATDPAVDVDALGGWGSGTARFVPSVRFWPGGSAILSSYMAPDYGSGTSSRLWLGQCDFCFGIWRRTTDARTPADIRTLYPRYVLNENLETHLGPREFSSLLPEEGRGGALQSGPLAVAWYGAGDRVTTAIRRMRACAVLSAFYNDVDEVWIGSRPCPGLAGTSETEDWVFLRDGTTYLGLHPLALTNHGRSRALAVMRVGRFRVVVFENYDGPDREFSPAALRQTRNGFVLCLGSAAEWGGGFEQFRSSCQEAQISDTAYQSDRRVRARWGGREVEALWDMQTEDLLWARIDGRFVDAEKPAQALGTAVSS